MEVSVKRQERSRKPIRIAIAGQLRSGKDTMAKYLVSQGFEHCKLSEGITDIASVFLEDIFGEKGKKREIYTTIGQSMRQLDPEVWLKYTWGNAPKTKNVVISDVRQKNEEEFLRSQGFVIVGVESPMTMRYERAMEDGDFKESDMNHETELSVQTISCDYYIQNEGTVMDLYDKTEALLDRIYVKCKMN